MPQVTYFNTANAREMSARGHEAKRLAAIQRMNGDIPKPLLPDDKFRLLTLSRVRRQMEKVFGLMDDEEDPSKLDRLASALDRLAGRERELANRSLPPSQKPIGTTSKRSPEPSSEPVAAPVVVSVPAAVPPETPQST